MTHKEKALKMCQQFGNTTKFAEDCNDGYTLPLRVAKLCALIAVDEIIASIPTLPNDNSSLEKTTAITYWVDVKNELLKQQNNG